MADNKFYVIGVYGTPWVLDSFASASKADAAISWQGDQRSNWVVARRTGPDTFYSALRGNLTVGCGPYTGEAFEAFKAEWKA